MDAIHEDLPLSGDVLVMVNGMGGTPLIELYIVFAEVVDYLAEKGREPHAQPRRQLHHQPGHAGFSITTCRLDDQLTRLWDFPVETPALRWGR